MQQSHPNLLDYRAEPRAPVIRSSIVIFAVVGLAIAAVAMGIVALDVAPAKTMRVRQQSAPASFPATTISR